jgi:hypothetical protein
MTLLFVLLGLAIIICIARYNENDSLFWKLLVSFIGSFAIATAAYTILNEDESDNDLVQVYPTQGLMATSCAHLPMCCTLTDVLSLTPVGANQKPVSQEYTPVLNKVVNTFSKVLPVARDQPQFFKYFDTS